MTQDIKQFPTLPEKEQDAFLKIIGLLATLDGPQTDIAARIGHYSTDPSVNQSWRQSPTRRASTTTVTHMSFLPSLLLTDKMNHLKPEEKMKCY